MGGKELCCALMTYFINSLPWAVKFLLQHSFILLLDKQLEKGIMGVL